ncbi:hypothetical protein AX16_007691 [Volvariella volvacea WC 439]|nr:hypothetical protein AX16_007691 [Volvariella volvacea WC 439]
MTRIPTEILLHFLSDFLPPSLGPTTDLYWPPSGDPCHQRCTSICLAELADLRLVCWDWCQAITPLLYSKFILIIEPRKSLQQQLAVFQTHAHLIHHLVICSNIPPHERSDPSFEGGKVRFLDAELIEACLGQCINLRIMQLINAHDGLSTIPPNKLTNIFQSNRSNLSHLSSLTIGDNLSHCPQLTASNYLVGLGPVICSNLTNLEIAVQCPIGSSFRWQDQRRLYPLPSSFPNLSRLLLRWPGYGGDGLSKLYERLISRIIRKEIAEPGSTKNRHNYKCVVPLRELILDSYTPHSEFQWLDELLNINNLRSVLTTLEIRLRSVYETSQTYAETYYQLPLHILDLCPSLNAFRFFSHIQSTTLELLPRRLNEVGLEVVSVLQDYPASEFFSESTLMDLRPIIYWVRSNSKEQSMKNITVAFAQHKAGSNKICGSGVPEEMCEDWKVLEQECAARGIALHIFHGDSLECTWI